jgi:dienelactone hydrolase
VRGTPVVAALSLLLAQEEAPFYNDKQNLLTYLDSRLVAQPVTSTADWNVRRSHILQNMQRVMGPLPETATTGLDLEFGPSEGLPGFRRRLITFASEVPSSGGKPDRVPALLLLPKEIKDGSRAPAVLCLHQTTRIGKGEPAGVGGKPDLHYAAELAGRGFVTLAPDYPNFGDYTFDPYAHGYVSATMKAIVNHRRAIDVLRSLPEVDPDKIGVIGHSLGGHNSLFLAAFDPRVKAVVTSCGFNSFSKYKGGDLTGWSHKGYMPRIAEVYAKVPARMPFDFTEVLAALAPRPVFINAPLGDSNFEVSGVKDCEAAASQIYDKVFHARDRLVAVYSEAGHEFPLAIRQQAYSFLEGWLR